MRDAALNLLRDLTEAHGAPGHEGDVRAIFHRELRGLGEFDSDRLGSIVCARQTRGDAPRVMLTAHMDEVGFLIQNVQENGLLQIVALGSWWTHNLLAHRVRVKTRSGREVGGLIVSTPPHFLEESERSKVLPMDKLLVDIGASSRKQAEEEVGVRAGDAIVPDTPMTPLANGNLLMGKAFDNRAGLAAVIQAFQQLAAGSGLPNTLLAVGTVQEEIGCRGAATAAALARPDVALILEGAPADDSPGKTGVGVQSALGKGPQVRIMDPSAMMSPALVDFVCEVATEKGIPHQIAVRRSGATDARSFHVSGVGVPCVVIGVPARYIHSHNSIINLDDYFATVALVVEVAKQLDRESVSRLTDFVPRQR
jgi:putative aminopeptidase FrvX